MMLRLKALSIVEQVVLALSLVLLGFLLFDPFMLERSRALAPEERVRFRPGERPANAPVDLPRPAWDPRRLAKVERKGTEAGTEITREYFFSEPKEFDSLKL